MEPDEHLLNLSEKGRVEIANEVQPQRRARQPGAGECIIQLAVPQCFPMFVVLYSFNTAETFFTKSSKSKGKNFNFICQSI